MKNNQKISTIALALGLALFLGSPVNAQQQGNGKKNREQSGEAKGQQKADDKQRGRSAEARNGSVYNNKENRDNRNGQRQDENRVKGNKGNAKNNNEEDANGVKNNPGNAYGKYKGNLSGREFGQQRAAQARLIGEQKRVELKTSVNQGEEKVKEAKNKIARAKDNLEKNRKAKSISDNEYQQKLSRLEKAERAVQELEQKVEEGRQLTLLFVE